ncbi:MAG: hypothetical protein EPO65_02360 [Dehalococcoidia bacterium]|nr:MAG: hypothetical protein EPO65_02360 [Dehalococcoidia bacterium]
MNRLTIAATAIGAAVLVAGGAALALQSGGDDSSAGAPAAPAQASSAAADSSGSRARYIEAAGYPRPVLFRNGIETWGIRGVPTEEMVALAKPYDMVIAKALDEEVVDRAKVAPYMVAIKRAAPEKIVLDHFLLIGRNPKSQYPPVWPGHWLLLNGTTLASDLGDGAGDTTLVLTDRAAVAAGDDVQVTALDAAGKPDYSRVEQMRVLSVAGDRATVQRGNYGTTRQRFEARRTRVAAHAAVTYGGGDPIWKYNFCRESPRDPSNRRLIEALAQPLAEYLKPGAILDGLDGYQFDVAAFSTTGQNQGQRRLDCDNDGAPDSGYVKGVSSYGLGVVEFQSVLRGLVGEKVLLISEATGWWSARDVAFANGMENESFPDLHHWEQFSSAYQRYQFWRETARAPRLSYLQLKETTEAFTRCPVEDKGTNWKIRLSLGAALLGDGYFAYMSTNEEGRPECNYVDRTRNNLNVSEIEEFSGGADKRYHYLGSPRGEAQHVDLLGSAPNLIGNGGFEGDTAGAAVVLVRGAAGTLTRDTSNPGEGTASLRVDVPSLLADPQDNHVQVRVGPFRVEKGKEYTLRFRIRADTGYGVISPLFAEAPMRVAMNLTAGGQAPAEQDVMATKAWHDYSLSFVAAADDAAANLFVLLGKEAGSVWLDGLRLQAGPGDAFARRFEHGAVLVNGSASPATFDLSALFPGTAFRRLRGTQDVGFNNGAAVGGRVTVPARDALIVVDTKSLP